MESSVGTELIVRRARTRTTVTSAMFVVSMSGKLRQRALATALPLAEPCIPFAVCLKVLPVAAVRLFHLLQRSIDAGKRAGGGPTVRTAPLPGAACPRLRCGSAPRRARCRLLDLGVKELAVGGCVLASTLLLVKVQRDGGERDAVAARRGGWLVEQWQSRRRACSVVGVGSCTQPTEVSGSLNNDLMLHAYLSESSVCCVCASCWSWHCSSCPCASTEAGTCSCFPC